MDDTEAFAAAFPVGTAVRAVSVGLVSDHDGRRAAVQELTARQEALASAENGKPVKTKLSFEAVTPGRSVSGCGCVLFSVTGELRPLQCPYPFWWSHLMVGCGTCSHDIMGDLSIAACAHVVVVPGAHQGMHALQVCAGGVARSPVGFPVSLRARIAGRRRVIRGRSGYRGLRDAIPSGRTAHLHCARGDKTFHPLLPYDQSLQASAKEIFYACTFGSYTMLTLFAAGGQKAAAP